MIHLIRCILYDTSIYKFYDKNTWEVYNLFLGHLLSTKHSTFEGATTFGQTPIGPMTFGQI